MLSVSIDTGNLEKQLKQLAKVSGKSVQHLVYDEMRMWSNDLIKRFPPFPAGGSAKGASVAAKRVGEKAVTAGFHSLFYEVPGPGATNTKRSTISKGSGIALRHKRARNKRGRVEAGRGIRARVGAKRADLNRTIKKVKKHVGRLKAGWMKSAAYYARKSRGKVKAPAWVKRHSERGSVSDRMRRDGNGSAAASNTVDYASAPSSIKSIVQFTQRQRQKHLVIATKKALRAATTKFNKAA